MAMPVTVRWAMIFLDGQLRLHKDPGGRGAVKPDGFRDARIARRRNLERNAKWESVGQW